jgi:cysteinyl-tRNA synthetase
VALRVYNTLSRKLEEFKPKEGKKVKMFVCGPTVYDYSHIGHAKTYIAFDVIARYLRYRGYDVYYLQNITDIDDKIIARANERGVASKQLSEEYTRIYLADMKALNINSVDRYAPASEHIPQIIVQIKGLVEKEYAYEISDGIYFDVSKFPEYGRLSGYTGDEVRKHRVEPNPEKRNPEDFSLWKKAKPGEPSWDSPWGKGRPGWHIEDTAITIDAFGPQYDLHGGGSDLIFPHHDCEIAQAEAFTGKKPFVKYWLHTGFLNVEGRKMSKSLGNFLIINDAVKCHGADTIRFFFAMAPYRQPINYNEKGIKEAGKELEKIKNLLNNLGFISGTARTDITAEEKGLLDSIPKYKERFIAGMDNDFNTSEAVAVVMELVREANRLVSDKKLNSRQLIDALLSIFTELGGVLGFDFIPAKKQEAPEEVMEYVRQREEARKKKDWKTADGLRKRIRNLGWDVLDTPQGPDIRKISQS